MKTEATTPMIAERNRFLNWCNDQTTMEKFTLERDIDFTGVEFTPKILASGKTFDGDGHAISGIKMNGKPHAGLFTENFGTIQNVIVKNASISGGRTYGGAIAAINRDTILYCQAIDCVIHGNYIGGITGANSGETIAGCYVKGGAFTGIYTGGIAGHSASGTNTIIGCYAAPKIVIGAKNKGGVVGLNSGTVAHCYYAPRLSVRIKGDDVENKTMPGTLADCFLRMNTALNEAGYFKVWTVDGIDTTIIPKSGK